MIWNILCQNSYHHIIDQKHSEEIVKSIELILNKISVFYFNQNIYCETQELHVFFLHSIIYNNYLCKQYLHIYHLLSIQKKLNKALSITYLENIKSTIYYN